MELSFPVPRSESSIIQVVPKSCHTQGQVIPKYNKMHKIHERVHCWSERKTLSNWRVVTFCLSVCLQNGHRSNLLRMGWWWPAGNGRILVLIWSGIWMQDDISTSLPLRERAFMAACRFVSPLRHRLISYSIAIVWFRGAYVMRLAWNWNHRSYACSKCVNTSVSLYVV